MANYYFNPARYHPVQYPINGGGWNNYPFTQIPTTKAAPPASKKVIQIPVQFVGTEKTRSVSVSALKIQKVFRGFLVRKNVKRIVKIKREVDEIEKKIEKKEVIDLICRDGKERLRFNEILMGLLLKLDSIRGIDSGVRDCRKMVIKKAIMLQERLDSIHSVENVNYEERNKDQDQNIEVDDHVEPEFEHEKDEFGLQGLVESARDGGGSMVEFPEKSQFDGDSGNGGNGSMVEFPEKSQFDGDSGNGDDGSMVESPEKSEHGSMVESPEKSEFKVENECFELAKDVQEEDKVTEEDMKKEEGEEMVVETQEPDLIQVDQVGGEAMNVDNEEKHGGGGGEEDRKDLMVRMIEGNEKLTGLVAELCERNEMQTRLISSLSRRVENLEKAWKSERLRRKKKRTDTMSNATQCGRKS